MNKRNSEEVSLADISYNKMRVKEGTHMSHVIPEHQVS